MRSMLFRFSPLGLLLLGVLGYTSGVSLPGLSRSSEVASTTYNAMTVTTKDGTTHIVRWNGCQDHITYRVDLSGVRAGDRRATLRTIRQGFKKLSAVNGISYRYKGLTNFVPTKSGLKDGPAEIVVAAVSPASTDFSFEGDTLGVGGVLWNSWKDDTGAVQVAAVRGYVILNATSLPDLKAGFGKGETVGNLVEHELGHVMGLEHVDSTRNIMDATLTGKAPNGYGPGDRRGLIALGKDAGCLQLPSSAAPDLS